MFRQTILRARSRLSPPQSRRYAAPTTPPPSTQSRIARINRRLPRFLHKHTAALASAPVSHITSFLILHEMTAIIPLLGLAATFHYTHYLPSWFAEGAWVLNGVERFGKYFRRKGWIRSGEAEEAEFEVEMRRRDRAWNVGEGGVRLVVEFATAYAITKMLLPIRVVLSVWGTPWFAKRTVVPLMGWAGKVFNRGKKTPGVPGAGTGAVEGGMCFGGSERTYTARTHTATGNGYYQDRRGNSCFGNGRQQQYTTRTRVASGNRYYSEQTQRSRHGGRYYPTQYYAQRPCGRYMSGAMAYPARHLQPIGYAQHGQHQHVGSPRDVVPRYGVGRYLPGVRATMPNSAVSAFPKPRHQYIYTPRYGQRGYLSYAGQQPNGAYPTGVVPNGMGYGVGMGVGMGVGVGVGVGMAAAYPGVYHTPTYSSYPYGANYYSPAYTHASYGGYHNYGLYGSMYPIANFYSPYQRPFYNTVPNYGYTAHVYPPGPTTTTTTYHVANSHAHVASPPQVRTETRHACNHSQGPTREDIQMENRRIATERGAYDARRIKPADARDDDPFWCKERNGEWHLRTYYQIENECYPGRWLMDAELGFLVFNRD
ncbi:hypothetical protein P153DRAFT_324855 [Dothidotthia symphoricarpi CBS 119687]|uniref:Uncharacterized protein n=1 Tax=Dothidotthia symphoricarpi CBS 119687 TaxID=1392245 RepID=A0A6A6A2V2_9PLEO|nr:uncharacterized protein P153DRAFT_324855 [Dothidotthia symphoricarpi CBS 119687]KAF2125493.1 hypothetical protein P153DRAFT_324855 [Dothidotthia symphoricarpi CBS 119687]